MTADEVIRDAQDYRGYLVSAIIFFILFLVTANVVVFGAFCLFLYIGVRKYNRRNRNIYI